MTGKRLGQREEVRGELGIVLGGGGRRVWVQIAERRAKASGEREDACEQLLRSAVVVNFIRKAGAVNEREGVVAGGAGVRESLLIPGVILHRHTGQLTDASRTPRGPRGGCLPVVALLRASSLA